MQKEIKTPRNKKISYSIRRLILVENDKPVSTSPIKNNWYSTTYFNKELIFEKVDLPIQQSMKLTEKIAALGTRIFLKLQNRGTKKFVDDFVKKLRFIEPVNGGFRIKDYDKNVETEIKWYSVKNAELFEDHIIFHLLNNRPPITVPEKYHQNWYKLIQEVPQDYPSYDYDYVKSFFENLQGCEICGLMAIHKGECLNCGNETWNTELEEEYESKESYIKEMQYDQFAPDEESKKVIISNNADYGFKSYPDWIPLVKEGDYRNDRI